MQTPVDFFPDAEAQRIVYVRAVKTEDLPPELRAQAGPAKTVYSVNTVDGEQVALVHNRNQALRLARANELTPVSVH